MKKNDGKMLKHINRGGLDMAKLYFFILLVVLNNIAFAETFPPKLNFTDLVAGPSTGLGDGKGSGVIVTVWGQFLGSQQSTSKILLSDQDGNEHEAAYVYYWKNADGELPGGPANLFKSHNMQEIAFSIPDVPSGDWFISVVVNGNNSNLLPFKVRDGRIYHVMASGVNLENTEGSFDKPWASLRFALDQVKTPGGTVYIHDSLVAFAGTGPDQGRAIFWDTSSASSDGYDNQMGIVAYPDSRAEANSKLTVSNYHTSGMVLSKFQVKTSNCYEVNGKPYTAPDGLTECSPSGTGSFGIQGTAYGRIIGNTVTDREGRCATGMQGGIYAVNGGEEDRISGLKVFGNEIHDYGCTGTSKFQHTTYFSIRQSSNPEIAVWQIGWNYIHDNQTKFGIHNYDQTGTTGGVCGQPIGTLKIHDNVIVNQSGSGIDVAAVRCVSWANDFDIYNNLLINTALLGAWNGVDPETAKDPATGAIAIGNGGLQGNVNIFNNSIYKWDQDNAQYGVKACFGFVDGRGYGPSIVDFSQNICITEEDKRFLGFNVNSAPYATELKAQLEGANNVLHYTLEDPVLAILPVAPEDQPIYINTITSDPSIIFKMDVLNVSIGKNSVIQKSGDRLTSHDLYGRPRGLLTEPGAVIYVTKPLPPTNLSFQY